MAALREGEVDEVVVETIVLDVEGLEVPACHARPEGMPRAGVVVHPDIMGVRPLFEDMSRRLATHGLAVMCVEPFATIPAQERATLEPPARMERIAGFDDATQLSILEAAADHLVVHDDVAHLATIGFCMGGHYVLKAAATDRFDAAVAFYGMIRVPDAWAGPGVGEPLEHIAEACATLAIFGTADPWTPPADIDALRAAWANRDDCEVVVFEGADHGFVHDPDRPAHRPDDAAAAWDRCLAWIG